jgi:translation elongation factor EF-Tu-like GTPase
VCVGGGGGGGDRHHQWLWAYRQGPWQPALHDLPFFVGTIGHVDHRKYTATNGCGRIGKVHGNLHCITPHSFVGTIGHVDERKYTAMITKVLADVGSSS